MAWAIYSIKNLWNWKKNAWWVGLKDIYFLSKKIIYSMWNVKIYNAIKCVWMIESFNFFHVWYFHHFLFFKNLFCWLLAEVTLVRLIWCRQTMKFLIFQFGLLSFTNRNHYSWLHAAVKKRKLLAVVYNGKICRQLLMMRKPEKTKENSFDIFIFGKRIQKRLSLYILR